MATTDRKVKRIVAVLLIENPSRDGATYQATIHSPQIVYDDPAATVAADQGDKGHAFSFSETDGKLSLDDIKANLLAQAQTEIKG